MELTYTYQSQIVVSVGDIYPPGATKAPKGFKLTGEFRPPKAGEFFLSWPHGSAIKDTFDYAVSMPRLILTPAPVRKQYIFTETGEERIPRRGEWFSAQNADVQPVWCSSSTATTSTRKILTLEVREIQKP